LKKIHYFSFSVYNLVVQKFWNSGKACDYILRKASDAVDHILPSRPGIKRLKKAGLVEDQIIKEPYQRQ